MKIIDNVKKYKAGLITGATSVLVVAVLIVGFVLNLAEREKSATDSAGQASAGNLKQDKKEGTTEEETTSEPEGEHQEEPATLLQVTVTSDDTTVIQNPDGTTSTLNPGETLNIVKEVTNENGEKMYQLDNGGYVSAEKVSTPVTKPVSNPTVNSNSANNPQTDAPTVSQEQFQTPAPTPKQTEAPTPKPTEAPTQAPTEAPNPWLTYEGYREEEIEKFKSKLVALRQSEIPKYGYLSEYATRYMNPQWNDTLYRIAKERAREVVSNYSHTSAGNYCSGYNVIECLTATPYYESGYAEDAYNHWYQSIDHRNGMITGGDQYAVAFYQKGGHVYAIFIAGDSNDYKVENFAAYYSEDWQEVGYASQQQAYNWLYNSFVQTHGTPIIR